MTVGRVMTAWGVSGWVRVEPETDDPLRFRKLTRVRLVPRHGPPRWMTIQGVRVQGGQVRLRFEGVETREAAKLLANSLLQIPPEEVLPLPEGEFYRFQFLGLEVWTEEGRHLGRVVDVLETGANDVLVVRGEGWEILLPTLRQVIRRVDLPQRRMEVALLPGLEEATGRTYAD
ncbi:MULTISPECIES: ribosome maturation factor RimM [Limnochorda]|uniref:ribosome maturation factor RimM n=1 Tax=Limnochorda TaxID=1676651 RepID=UPI0018487981|nr:ribosome maturation factor RimM [Limnochorda pilosa]MBO2487009.1 16S rRNA processing protein RimM [Bacillota bacterium]MBO2518195.1 16S rRNA processing protein RimM [Bacillota bacterium]NMA70333.1 16S rRNA processing protein RimM [Bacillota bacterium]